MSVTASCGTSSADPTPPGGGRFGNGALEAAAAFVPSHLAEGMLLSGGPDVAVTGDPTTIDTSSRTIDGRTSPYFVLRDGYAVLFANRVVFDHDVVITGARPLIVVANGDVTVSASIDLGAHGSVPGPGAATFGAGEGGPGDTFVPGEVRVSSGGGGGGGTNGADGLIGDAPAPAGVGGVPMGSDGGAGASGTAASRIAYSCCASAGLETAIRFDEKMKYQRRTRSQAANLDLP